MPGRLATSNAAPPTEPGLTASPSDAAPAADSEVCELEEETGPLRCCAVTRERLPKERMIRFVLAPDRSIVPDLAAKLPGRGIWLSARGDVIETARTRGAFAKAARGPVTVPPDLTSGLSAALTRRVAEHLGLARRAGQAVAGFAKAREWLVAGRVGLVVEARDGSPDERERFLAAVPASVRPDVVTPLDAAELGAVFGRDRAVHVVIAPGRLAERLRCEAERLAGLAVGQDRISRSSPTGDAGASGERRRNTTCPSGGAGRKD